MHTQQSKVGLLSARPCWGQVSCGSQLASQHTVTRSIFARTARIARSNLGRPSHAKPCTAQGQQSVKSRELSLLSTWKRPSGQNKAALACHTAPKGTICAVPVDQPRAKCPMQGPLSTHQTPFSRQVFVSLQANSRKFSQTSRPS